MKLTTTITIEPIQDFDIEEILRIQAENNLGWWQQQDYIEEIQRRDTLSFVVKKDKVIIGFIISRLITTELTKIHIPNNNSKIKRKSEVEIYNLAVEMNHRKEGIGTLLINKIIKAASKKQAVSIWLEVRVSNSAAISFYKKNKFKEVYQRKNFYRHPPEDALIMKLDILNHVKNLQKIAKIET